MKAMMSIFMVTIMALTLASAGGAASGSSLNDNTGLFSGVHNTSAGVSFGDAEPGGVLSTPPAYADYIDSLDIPYKTTAKDKKAPDMTNIW